MGHSLGAPQLIDGGFHHNPSGSEITVYSKDGAMHHKLLEHDLAADYPIAYSVGYGIVGHSYLIELGGHLFQSPASYYIARSEWDVSPGYEHDHLLDFTRSISQDCLFCHAGTVEKTAGHTELTPIACERCHGPSEKHRANPVPGTIVNPARLAGRERDSVCEQCHLEGATTVLNPGKYWTDFRPGESLEQVEIHYVYRTASGDQESILAVSHAEQLALSKCLRASGGKLWCGSCHDPHGEPVADRKQQIRQICESCHAPAQLASTHKLADQDCVTCHMPRRNAADIAHATITEHRIVRWPTSLLNVSEKPRLGPWHDPPPEFATRNLGLAYFNVAREKRSAAYFEHSYELLSSLAPSQKDHAVSAAQGYMLLGSGQARDAVPFFERATELAPERAEYWLDLGVAQSASGDAGAAIQSLRRSIHLDPYDYRPYRSLANLYAKTGQREQSQAVVSEFLRLVPQSLTMRIAPAEPINLP